MNKKRKLRLWVVIAFAIICLIGALYSSYKIITWKIDVNTNNKIKKEIKKSITVNNKEEYIIDFKSLKNINPDTIAYINVNNTNINYIVVKCQDNKYYLSHNFEKKKNLAGWIFMDYHNKLDDNDRNIIIYGHNMKDGSMFDSLKNTLTKEWYQNEDNHIITLVTEENTYRYQVFSNYDIITEDYYINTIFSNDEEFFNFINTLQKRSIYDYKVNLTKEDRILTLSSCLGDGRKRVVLHAKLIEKK